MAGTYSDDDVVEVNEVQFPRLERSVGNKKLANELFSALPVEVTVELGRTKIPLKDIYELSEGAIIELERLAGEPLDLVVNGQVIAQGEVVAIDENYGLRITNIVAR